MNTQTQEALKIGDRVVIKDTAGFSKRLHGIITDFKQDKFWVLRDGADKPVWFYPDELQLEEALAQPAQEPVGYTTEFDLETALQGNTLLWFANKNGKYNIPLYTHPAPSWQGLSERKLREMWMETDNISWIAFKETYRAIEQALKEKNT